MSAIAQSVAGCSLPTSEPVLVAVSGGADSMVLLHALRNHRIVVAHFNHQLRDGASDADQQLVEQTADDFNVPIVIGNWEPNKESIRRHGLEKAARDARLNFLSKTARQYQCRWVAMGHHADDQVETFFWRLLRGAGGRGLGGMKAVAPFPKQPSLQIVRPLLKHRKTEILAHANTEGVLFCEDDSNMDSAHLRNRIRNKLLPLLRDEFHLQTDSAVLQSQNLVSEDADCIKIIAAEWLAAKAPQPFDALHPALQRQVIWHQLIAFGVEPGHQLIEHLRLSPGQSQSINSAERLTRDIAGRLHSKKSETDKHFLESSEWTFHSGWNESEFGGATLRCRSGTDKLAVPGFGVECFDADRVGPSVVLRHWQAGDRFHPIGLERSTKLQDLFTNAKVPSPEKHRRIIACSAKGEIFWVQGLRIGDWAKIRPNTRRFLEWRWMPV
ncbi:MAG: tRNA lysidine(34) synthetase TilS [Verrucomicrobia subdivision 3 bacterium]|nr:tRNA lysidine(34) synthetase TilS [Limisphaerales bacterium]